MEMSVGVKRVDPEMLREGMVIALPVLNQRGNVVVPQNKVVTEEVIRMVFACMPIIVHVYTENSEFGKIKVMEHDTEIRTEQLSNVIDDIKEGRKIPGAKLEKMISDAMDLAKNTYGLNAYLQILRDKNEYTFNHSVSVGIMAKLFSGWMRLTEAEQKDLIVASSLHDIGKLSIEENILEKPTKLTDTEYNEIKKHVLHGGELLVMSKAPEHITRAVMEHHERPDGRGYPFGKTEEQISVYGGMIAIADVYDALVSKRSYRDAMSPFEAFSIMQKDQFHQFKYDLLSVFVDNVTHSYLNSKVELSDGRMGEIVFINPFQLLRPYIRLEGGEIINLLSMPQLRIVRVF